MRDRRLKPTTVLTDTEVTEVAKRLRSIFGERFAALADSYGVSLEDGVRFASLSKRCEQERLARAWTIKDVARQLYVPQYWLKDIEAGRTRQIRPDVLRAYLAHLQLDSWYRRWRRANRHLASRLELGAQPKPTSRGRKARSNKALHLTRSAMASGRGPRR